MTGKQDAIRSALTNQAFCCYRCRRSLWKQWRKNNDKPQNYVVQTYPDGTICPILCHDCFMEGAESQD